MNVIIMIITAVIAVVVAVYAILATRTSTSSTPSNTSLLAVRSLLAEKPQLMLPVWVEGTCYYKDCLHRCLNCHEVDNNSCRHFITEEDVAIEAEWEYHEDKYSQYDVEYMYAQRDKVALSKRDWEGRYFRKKTHGKPKRVTERRRRRIVYRQVIQNDTRPKYAEYNVSLLAEIPDAR